MLVLAVLDDHENNTHLKYYLYARKSSESDERQAVPLDSQLTKEVNLPIIGQGVRSGFLTAWLGSGCWASAAPLSLVGRENACGAFSGCTRYTEPLFAVQKDLVLAP